MKRKSEVIGTAIKQVVSAIETLQPEAARRVVNAAMILCEQDAGGLLPVKGGKLRRLLRAAKPKGKRNAK